MSARKLVIGLLISMVIGIVTVFTLTLGLAQQKPTPYELPHIIQWGASDVGSLLYAQPVTMAEKIAPVLGSKIRLIPGNDVDRLNMMRSGKAQLATMAADTYWASMGLSYYSTFALGPQRLRIVWAGWPYYGASTGIVTKTSGIKTPYDLKGKRIGVVVGAAYSIEGMKANLAWAKLTMKDVRIVEVSTQGAISKALVEGKIDFYMGATNAPGVYEAEASPYGVYLVRYPHEDKEAWARYRKFMPYHVPGYATVGATIKPGERVPTPNYAHPITICLSDQQEEFVYAICKAIYSKIDEIATAYPGNDAMRPDRAITPEIAVMAPFHAGAVRLYKEIGKWSKALDDAQNKRLAYLGEVQKRWEAFSDEAQEKMAKTGKKIDVSKEWGEIVQKEIGLGID